MTVAKSVFTSSKHARFNRAAGVSAKTQEVILNKHAIAAVKNNQNKDLDEQV